MGWNELTAPLLAPCEFAGARVVKAAAWSCLNVLVLVVSDIKRFADVMWYLSFGSKKFLYHLYHLIQKVFVSLGFSSKRFLYLWIRRFSEVFVSLDPKGFRIFG
jgi:hypothetical protein